MREQEERDIEIHTGSGCDIGGDSDCKVGGAAKSGGEWQRVKIREGERPESGNEQRAERESGGRRVGERVSEQ
ncbi:hypothetical protein FH972_004460 [Carpinus fangiana]|uniref:Uncharacterized protein n=1 Tax=Carpinus fangiana TaxID=176857 RepID=A0A5N6QNY2_9ROSI|nr:hypothetical protein FH972_004460 [Carpinus fangiana]